MSELENMIVEANQQVAQHTEGVLRQRVAMLLSPEAQKVLDVRYDPAHSALLIGCLGVPCWLQLAPDGAHVWQFGCPWWQTPIHEDKLFEARVLAEVGKLKMKIEGMLEKLDPSKLN